MQVFIDLQVVIQHTNTVLAMVKLLHLQDWYAF